MALYEIAYIEIIGFPLIIWGGIFTLLLVLATSLSGYLATKGYKSMTMKRHKLIAGISILFAISHAILAISSNLGI